MCALPSVLAKPIASFVFVHIECDFVHKIWQHHQDFWLFIVTVLATLHAKTEHDHICCENADQRSFWGESHLLCKVLSTWFQSAQGAVCRRNYMATLPLADSPRLIRYFDDTWEGDKTLDRCCCACAGERSKLVNELSKTVLFLFKSQQ